MRHTLLASVILTCLCLSAADAGWPGRRRSCPGSSLLVAPDVSPEDAVRRVLSDQVAAWNKGDLQGFMAGYWISPDLSFFSGKERTRGWQATLERYVKKYRSEGKEMGKLTFSELTVDVHSPEAALVRGRWELEMSKDKPGGLFTLIFKRFPDGWRIVHDHTSG
jgi:beta-aspartyl-peptidase (threonine type)